MRKIVILLETVFDIRFTPVGRKRRGTAPAVYVKASSSIHRHILQQLEKMLLIEADQESG